ncbi:MAG TPA: ABC transporter substrate-binding protein [Methylomirabilota bacterium]|nr:ABC transporter substrate-binding protein [Methylomirabilota bacterium]
MDRRRFLLTSLASLVAPFTVDAQQMAKVHRIGMLETRSPALNAANIDAFLQGMRELGYSEGENFEIEYRSSDGRDERFAGLALELVNLKVDLILTRGTPAVLAAKRATRTIPVVMAASGGPIEAGIVTSLARPDANITGLSSGITESFPKRVELLAELLPKLQRIGAILNMGNRVVPPQWTIVETSARSRGIQARLLDIRRPEDLPAAFEAASKAQAEAVVVGLDGVTQANLRPIAELALTHRLPSIYPARDYAHVGGLMTYGSSDFHMYHRAATFVHKIFKGAKPADLPIEQPTKYELFINLKTAKALGLMIPQSLLVRADRVIE